MLWSAYPDDVTVGVVLEGSVGHREPTLAFAHPYRVRGSTLQNCIWVLFQSKVITAPQLGACEWAEI